jgi:hypothetical protein
MTSLNSTVLSRADQLPPGDVLGALRGTPYPKSVLMCSPDHFDVVDVKNPYMRNHLGKGDGVKAKKQWTAIKRCFEEIGIQVEIIPPAKDCEATDWVGAILHGRASQTATRHKQISVPLHLGQICKSDPGQAENIQRGLRSELQQLCESSYAITGFKIDHEYGTYLLERYED